MRILAIVAIGAVLLGARAVQAQTIGKPAPVIKYEDDDENGNNNRNDDEKFLVRDYPGRVLVMYFWRTGNLESVELLKTITRLEKKYASKGVRFFQLTSDDKEKVEAFLTDNEVPRLRDFFSSARSVQMALGALSEPYVVIIDPRAIIRWRGHPLEDLEGQIEFCLARYPPPAGDRAWLGSRLRQAEKYLEAGEVGRAYTTAQQVVLYTDEENQLHGNAESLSEKLEGAAAEWLTEAIRHEQADELADAARIVAEISVRFEEKDVARDAQTEIGRMNGKRELKELIREALDGAKAGILLDDAALLEKSDQYEAATEIYRKVIEDFEDSKAARTAQKAIKRIENSPEIRDAVAAARQTRMADRLLDIGNRYTKIKMYEQARDAYERVLREFGKTDAAERAKKALQELPASTARARD